MSLRFFEIAEANHRIQNPITHEKLMLLGESLQLRPGMHLLDLACGKGEMLCQWARAWGIRGVGVDISPVFIKAARERARELGVEEQLKFVVENASTYRAEPTTFDVASCLGATWIGNGMVGTVALMRPALKDSGLILVGEPYWNEDPPPEAFDALGVRRDEFCTLANFLDRCKAAEVELVEMVLANPDSWDRYEARHWITVSNFLRENPDFPEAEELRAWMSHEREVYLEYGRRYFGWGAFVLRPINGERGY